MIKANGIKKSFNELEVLRGVDIEVAKGEMVAIVGPSGAGKSTLLQILGSLMKCDSGSVVINGTDISTLSSNQLAEFSNREIGFIFQFHHLLPEFTAVENVMLPALIAGCSRTDAQQRAMELLEQIGLKERFSHKPAQLSGGEQQRVAAARALINSPSLILADEPSGNLDTHNRDELHKLLLTLKQQNNLTVVMVTHDSTLADLADRKIVLIDGKQQVE